MGMKRCWSRKYFTELEDQRYACVFCHQSYVCSTTKFKNHLKKCPLIPPDVRQEINTLLARREEANSLTGSLKRGHSEGDDDEDEIRTKYSRNGSFIEMPSTSGLNQSILRLLDQHSNEPEENVELDESVVVQSNGKGVKSQVETERLNYLIRMFIVSSNSSPDVLENKYLKEFVQTLCPSFQLPNPQEFKEHVEQERRSILNYYQNHLQNSNSTENHVDVDVLNGNST